MLNDTTQIPPTWQPRNPPTKTTTDKANVICVHSRPIPPTLSLFCQRPSAQTVNPVLDRMVSNRCIESQRVLSLHFTLQTRRKEGPDVPGGPLSLRTRIRAHTIQPTTRFRRIGPSDIIRTPRTRAHSPSPLSVARAHCGDTADAVQTNYLRIYLVV